jgi:hypothetical protein
MLSERLIIPIITWIGSIARLGFGSAIIAALLHAKNLRIFLKIDQWNLTVVVVVSATIDIINTSALCVYLRRGRSTFKS